MTDTDTDPGTDSDSTVDLDHFYGEPLKPRPDADPPAAAPPTGSRSNAAGPRFRVANAFIDHTIRRLPLNALRVWLVYWRDTDAGTGVARTSYAGVAGRAGCSVRTVKNAVRLLKAWGLLETVARGGLGRGPNTVRVRPTPADGRAVS